MEKHCLSPAILAVIALACWPLETGYCQSDTGGVFRAAPDAGPNAARDANQPCVLLKNDNVLFGQAHQVGQFVIVRTGAGGEVRLPRKDVACWAGSTRDLYQYRVDHREAGDLAAHLRDARWCLRYDLLDLTARELRHIYALDPDNRQARQIEDQLRRRSRIQQPSQQTDHTKPGDDSVSEGLPPSVLPVRYETAGNSNSHGPVDVIALRRFASHVQPMLLNRCAHCHQQRSGGATDDVPWKLIKPPFGTRASAQMTRSNLMATMPYLDSIAPEQSELLVKATTAHGGGPAPLGIRSAKAIESLRDWIALAAQQSGNNRGDPVPTASFSQGVAAEPGTEVASVTSLPDQVEAPPAAVKDPRSDNGGGPARLPQVANPFDPDLFNRRFHMKTTGSQ